MTSSDGRKRERESLGWLTESTFVPKKSKEIQGVSGSTILDIKAQLFEAQQLAEKEKAGKFDARGSKLRRKAGIDVASILEKRNAGIEARDQKDRLQFKATQDKTLECFAALEKKALLYERLDRGELVDDAGLYEVNFQQKGTLADEAPLVEGSGWDAWQPVDTAGKAVQESGDMVTEDMLRERERRDWEEAERQQMKQEAENVDKRREHREVIREIADETSRARSRAAVEQKQRTVAADDKRKDIVNKFLKEQLAKKLGGSKKGATSSK